MQAGRQAVAPKTWAPTPPANCCVMEYLIELLPLTSKKRKSITSWLQYVYIYISYDQLSLFREQTSCQKGNKSAASQ